LKIQEFQVLETSCGKSRVFSCHRPKKLSRKSDYFPDEPNGRTDGLLVSKAHTNGKGASRKNFRLRALYVFVQVSVIFCRAQPPGFF